MNINNLFDYKNALLDVQKQESFRGNTILPSRIDLQIHRQQQTSQTNRSTNKSIIYVPTQVQINKRKQKKQLQRFTSTMPYTAQTTLRDEDYARLYINSIMNMSDQLSCGTPDKLDQERKT